MTGRMLAILVGCLLFAAGSAQAQTYDVLHSFCTQGDCLDGSGTSMGLSRDAAGNLYGATQSGGDNEKGVVFQLAPDGGGGWTYSVLYSFCPSRQCRDGAQPNSGMVVGSDGSLYGTTSSGGRRNLGVVYQLAPQGGGPWTLKVIHSFCKFVFCRDGTSPALALTYIGQGSGALYDGVSPLFGTASAGQYGRGIVYRLTPPSGSKKFWQDTVLYSFCREGDNCVKDGATPNALVAQSPDTIYGTTFGGGKYSGGAIFKLSKPNRNWRVSLLYSFCRNLKCPEGAGPNQLIGDGQGKLYGFAQVGGVNHACKETGGSCGTLFGFDTTSGAFTLLHAFCSAPGCSDGRTPTGFALDGNGDVIGTTGTGGAFDKGVLYRMSGGTLSVLHDFCAQANCADGGAPQGALAIDALGSIFGTTARGGSTDFGAIYRFEP